METGGRDGVMAAESCSGCLVPVGGDAGCIEALGLGGAQGSPNPIASEHTWCVREAASVLVVSAWWGSTDLSIDSR